jgi:molybdate transport system ATP-binding protein
MTAGNGLAATLCVERGRFRLDVHLDVPPGGVLALLGPNGAGKSTALRALAGLTPLTAGSIQLAGRCLDDPRTGVLVPPAERAVGMVFQDYLLFPHLSAVDNVAFGLRAGGRSRAASRRTALSWLERVGLREVAAARPGALSGGQAQRVALARALAPEPRLLLLDEPLAALDAGTRMSVRSELRRHLADYGGCTVLVTHDPLDAMVLGDSLVVVEDGRVVQSGAPGDVARAPRTEYVARLVGLNLYRGRASGTRVEVDGGGALATVDGRDGRVFATFAPGAVALHRAEPQGSARNTWPGRVAGLEQRGGTIRVEVAASPPVLADVTAAAVADLDLTVGSAVWAAVKATEVHTYPE